MTDSNNHPCNNFFPKSIWSHVWKYSYIFHWFYCHFNIFFRNLTKCLIKLFITINLKYFMFVLTKNNFLYSWRILKFENSTLVNFILVCSTKYWANNKINLFRFCYQLQAIHIPTFRKVIATKSTPKKFRYGS